MLSQNVTELDVVWVRCIPRVLSMQMWRGSALGVMPPLAACCSVVPCVCCPTLSPAPRRFQDHPDCVWRSFPGLASGEAEGCHCGSGHHSPQLV